MKRTTSKQRGSGTLLSGTLLWGCLSALTMAQSAVADCTPAANPDLNKDGIVSLADMYLVTHNFGPANSDGTGDPNCDGMVDSTDLTYVRSAMGQEFPQGPTLSLDAPASITVEEQSSTNLSFTVSIETDSEQTVLFSQVVTPLNNGVSLNTDAPSSWQSSADIDWVVNGTVTGNISGDYTLTTTATIQGTSISNSTTTVVTVLSSDPLAQVFVGPPAVEPGGLTVDTLTSTEFSVQLNTGVGTPNSIVLQQIDAQGNLITVLGNLYDDGQQGDLVADDLMYGATFNIPPTPEGNLYYRAAGQFSSGSVYSDITALPVRPFPNQLQASNPGALIDNGEGEKIFADELIVTFVEGSSSQDILDAVANLGGTIGGSIPSLNIFQIVFTAPKTIAELDALISAYEALPIVDFAEVSAQTTTDAVYPNDPQKGSLNNMTVTRVNEVWLLSPAGGSIAIVDTGVDYTHPDLDVTKGKDFVSGDDDPMDTHGHGTHVAGTSAAIINNSNNVAGVSQSKIIAVRGIGGSIASLAQAIKYAAGKASVVNISGGSYSGSGTLEKVTKDLSAKIIVSTAGNCGSGDKACPGAGAEVKRYPCANSNVFCVGNSTNTDGRATSSNFGSWVDIAAPGESVLSTKLGGGTTTMSGTSMAAPLVAGAARLIWNQHPGWSAAQVKERLLKTAAEPASLAGKKIGNRIDVFEAFFNGSFEIGVEDWAVTGTCSEKTQLGPITPTKGDKMLYCSTGPSGDQVAANITKLLSFVANSDFTIKFDYNFVSEEYPEYVGSIYDDSLQIKLIGPGGQETLLAQESINESSFTAVGGIDFPDGDSTVGQTGWKSVNVTIPVTQGAGSYRIIVEDAGDDIYDTVVLLDNIRLAP